MKITFILRRDLLSRHCFSFDCDPTMRLFTFIQLKSTRKPQPSFFSSSLRDSHTDKETPTTAAAPQPSYRQLPRSGLVPAGDTLIALCLAVISWIYPTDQDFHFVPAEMRLPTDSACWNAPPAILSLAGPCMSEKSSLRRRERFLDSVASGAASRLT